MYPEKFWSFGVDFIRSHTFNALNWEMTLNLKKKWHSVWWCYIADHQLSYSAEVTVTYCASVHSWVSFQSRLALTVTMTHCMQAREWEMIPAYNDQSGSDVAYVWLVFPRITSGRETDRNRQWRVTIILKCLPAIQKEPAADLIQMKRRRETRSVDLSARRRKTNNRRSSVWC